LVVFAAAAVVVMTPGVGLATDDGGAAGDGSANEVADDGGLDDGDGLVEWGEDVEVWGERADGSTFVPEVLPELRFGC